MADTDTTEGAIPEAALVELAEPVPEPSVVPNPAPEAIVTQKPPRRGGFAGGLLGGLIAAGVGFGVAQYVPDGWPLADTTALSVQLADQAQQIVALKAAMAAPDADVQARLATLEQRTAPDLAPLEARLAALDARLTKTESLPVGEGAMTPAQNAALMALQAEVQALKTAATPASVQAITAKAEVQLQEATDEAAAIKAEAEGIAKTAQTAAALGQLQAVLETGVPFAAVLTALPQVPDILTEAAETGVPTLAALQDGFPPAARLALDAALRANMGASWAERATSFLRTQTGARSLEPHEGSDPDAILSRAEAGLTAGDLATALTEITALPPEAQPALAEWRGLAERRMMAVQAVADLAATIGK